LRFNDEMLDISFAPIGEAGLEEAGGVIRGFSV
jgi:hypothetical protein